MTSKLNMLIDSTIVSKQTLVGTYWPEISNAAQPILPRSNAHFNSISGNEANGRDCGGTEVLRERLGD